MHAKPDLRVFLKSVITRSGSVITDVIPLKRTYAISNLAPAVAYGTNGDLLLPHGAPHLPDGGVSC